MGEDGGAGRRYNEKQVGALIQRATELHEERTGESERGLTLSEIEKIAAELGLPVEDMRSAALEMDGGKKGETGLDRTLSVSQALVVEGEITQEQWTELLLELRSFTGRSGTVTNIGKAREWTHYLGEGSEGINFTRTQVLVQPKNGQTSVQIQDHFGVAGLLYPLGFVVGAAGMLIVGEAWLSGLAMFAEAPAIVGLSATLLSGAAGVYAANATIKSWAAKKKDRLGVLAQRLRKTLTPETVVQPDFVPGTSGLESVTSQVASGGPEILRDIDGFSDSDTRPTKDGTRA